MAERVASDPQLVPLLIRVLRAAGSVGYDGALDAMAEALGGALKDPAKVDEAFLIVPALESFGPYHGLILEQVARHSGTTAEGESKHPTWIEPSLVEATGLPSAVVALCVADLRRAALVSSVVTWGGELGMGITNAGVAVLAALSTRKDH